jgi:hypothetical protein
LDGLLLAQLKQGQEHIIMGSQCWVFVFSWYPDEQLEQTVFELQVAQPVEHGLQLTLELRKYPVGHPLHTVIFF